LIQALEFLLLGLMTAAYRSAADLVCRCKPSQNTSNPIPVSPLHPLFRFYQELAVCLHAIRQNLGEMPRCYL